MWVHTEKDKEYEKDRDRGRETKKMREMKTHTLYLCTSLNLRIIPTTNAWSLHPFSPDYTLNNLNKDMKHKVWTLEHMR